jgi:hypothetical protein
MGSDLFHNTFFKKNSRHNKLLHLFLQEKSYYALAAFCEDMGEDILPYLDPLICRLVMSLQSSPRNLQETCMVCVEIVSN